MKIAPVLVLAALLGLSTAANAYLHKIIPQPFYAAKSEAYQYRQPVFSADGRYLVFLLQRDGMLGLRPASSLCFVRVRDINDFGMRFDGGIEELSSSSILLPYHVVGWVPGEPAGVAYLARRIDSPAGMSRVTLVRQRLDGTTIAPSPFEHEEPWPVIYQVVLSPNGKDLALQYSDGKESHFVYLPGGDAARMVEPVPTAYVGNATWTADGKSLIFSASGVKDNNGKMISGSIDLWRYDIIDGMLTRMTSSEDDLETHPVVTPDGRHLVYLAGPDSVAALGMAARNGLGKWMSRRDVRITPVHEFKPRTICTGMSPVISPDGQKVFVYQYRDVPNAQGEKIGMCFGVIYDLDGKELAAIDFGPETNYIGPDEGFSFYPDSRHFIYAKDGALWLDDIR
ncbi:MAG: TolB family protein [Armatimonadota bacterium]